MRLTKSTASPVIELPERYPYLPSDLGMGRCALEHNSNSINEGYHHIDSLSRNRREEIWCTTGRSWRARVPLIGWAPPRGYDQFYSPEWSPQNVWTIIDGGIKSGADVSIVPCAGSIAKAMKACTY